MWSLNVFEARNIRGNALHVLAVARRSLAEPCWTMLNHAEPLPFCFFFSNWSPPDLNRRTWSKLHPLELNFHHIPSFWIIPPSCSTWLYLLFIRAPSEAIKLWTKKCMNWSTWMKTTRILKLNGWPPSVTCRAPHVQSRRSGVVSFFLNN